MELTSAALRLLFGILSLAAMAGAVWAWPRLARQSPAAIAGRVGVLLGVQLVILATLGLLGNAYFEFYGSWADLLGTDAGDPIASVATSTTGALATAAGLVMGPRLPMAKKLGRLRQVEIKGQITGISAPAYVYLPPQYFQRRYATAKFPVVLGLTGYPGNELNLITRLRMPQTAARAVRHGTMAPAIIVMMRPTVVPPRDTECMDVPGGPQVETFFAVDVRTAIANAFRVGRDAADWGIFGGSTGGYCALKMTMRHPEAFSAAVSLSGYFKSAVDMTTGDLFGGSGTLMDENDLMWRLAHRPAPPVSVMVTSSRQGEADYQETEAFLAAVRPPMRAQALILPRGGHNFATWDREIPRALPWLVAHLRPPADPAPVTAPDTASVTASVTAK